jgi:hypothetical protein
MKKSISNTANDGRVGPKFVAILIFLLLWLIERIAVNNVVLKR